MRFDGEKLKALRVSRRWDQHKLAEAAREHGRVGITQSQISRYENGQEPSGRNALALAGALNVEVRDLYSGSPDDDAEDRLPRRQSLSGDLQRLAVLAGILERRPDLIEDILAAEAKDARAGARS